MSLNLSDLSVVTPANRTFCQCRFSRELHLSRQVYRQRVFPYPRQGGRRACRSCWAMTTWCGGGCRWSRSCSWRCRRTRPWDKSLRRHGGCNYFSYLELGFVILLHNRDSLPRGFTSHCGTSIWTTHSSQAQRQLSSIYRVKLKSQAAHLPSHGGGSDGREQRVGEVGDGDGDGGSKLGLCGHKHLTQSRSTSIV